MRARNHRTKTRATALVAMILLGMCSTGSTQEPPSASKNYVHLAKDFLDSVYPELATKPVLTVQSSMRYRDADEPMRFFSVRIGDGPPDQVTGYLGGYIGEKPKDFQAGPMHPKQYIEAMFVFDSDGRIAEFGTVGAVVGSPDAYKGLLDLYAVHPDWTDAQADDALKSAGARYGASEKEAFKKNLPMLLLKRFLGPLQITSVDFQFFRANLNDPILLVKWIVKAEVRSSNGANLNYELSFEPLKDDLISITRR